MTSLYVQFNPGFHFNANDHAFFPYKTLVLGAAMSMIQLLLAYEITSLKIFGSVGPSIKEGICGAPEIGQQVRVAGEFSLEDQSGIWAHIAALDFLTII